MDLRSQSWEYASEMVLKSVHMNLRTEEVPIRFLKDREGRLSHHKRSGWFSPWQAAWINLRAMFVYGADFFLYRPGFSSLLLGCADAPLSFGPVTVGPITFSLHWMLLGAHARDARPAVHLPGGSRAGVLRLLGRDDDALVRAVSVHAHRRWSRAGLFAAGLVLTGSLSCTTCATTSASTARDAQLTSA